MKGKQDRIWISLNAPDDEPCPLGYAMRSPCGHNDVEYLRATPELLALIEAAKAVSKAANVEYGPRPFNELMDAALAFAKEESGG